MQRLAARPHPRPAWVCRGVLAVCVSCCLSSVKPDRARTKGGFGISASDYELEGARTKGTRFG
eukprot:3115344-Prymnesium_polylepis.1